MKKRDIDRQTVVDVRGKLSHAMFHLRQAGNPDENDELHAGLNGVSAALDMVSRCLLDCVYASTGAEWDTDAPGNVVIGVTAHCQCGRVFTDEVLASGASLTDARVVRTLPMRQRDQIMNYAAAVLEGESR